MQQSEQSFPLSVTFRWPLFCSWLSSLAMLAIVRASPTLRQLRLSHPELSLLGVWVLASAQDNNDSMSWTPSQQWDLRDLWVDSSQSAFSSIRGLRWCKRILICENRNRFRYRSPSAWGILQSLAVSSAKSNFVRACFMVSLNSMSSGSMLQLPVNFWALSSFGFSNAQCSLSLCWELFDTLDQTSGRR